MEQKSTLKKLTIALAVALFSLPASAQLSLSAGAKAEADTGKGADASARSDGSATDVAAEKKDVPAVETTAAPAPDAIASEELAVAPEPAPEPAPAPAPMPISEPEEMVPADVPDTSGTVEYDGGFVIKTNDGNFKLKINGIVKTRYDLTNNAHYVDNGIEAGTNHTMHSSFSMPYARVGLSGNVFSPKLGYMLMWDFATNKPIYAFAKWTFIPKTLEIQVGQFKRPFARQYIISSAKQMFIDNPIGQMGAGIDVGIQLSNAYASATGLEWAIGVFNSANATDLASRGNDFSPAVVGRIGYNNGIKGYSDSDFEGGGFRFGIGLSESIEFDHDGDGVTTNYLELDGTMKVHGLAVSAAGYLETITGDGFWDTDATEDGGLNAIGAYLQAGFLISNMFEPIARYSMRNEYGTSDDLRQAITAGLTFHFFKNHAFKWENNFTLDLNPDETVDDPGQIYLDLIFSSQLQLSF